MKAYKVFNSDWTCRGFQYEVGKSYKTEETIGLCEHGFHACLKLIDCFVYYTFNPANKVAEVELLGEIQGSDDKVVTNHIKIVKELTWHEVLELVNTGRNNSGYSNSGNWNSGNWNSGDCNSGNSNSGNWNSCNYESGYFNTNRTTINVFNQSCDAEVWKRAEKPDFIYNVNVVEFVEDSDMVTEGYYKSIPYKEAWQKAYKKASKEDIELLKSLPNFDADVFYEITGIRIEEAK